jgi:hypothetical protein
MGDDDATFGTGDGDAERLTRASQAEAATLHDSTAFHEVDQRIGRFLDDLSPHKRIHSARGYLTPAAFETRWLQPAPMAVSVKLVPPYNGPNAWGHYTLCTTSCLSWESSHNSLPTYLARARCSDACVILSYRCHQCRTADDDASLMVILPLHHDPRMALIFGCHASARPVSPMISTDEVPLQRGT